jgi:hypothetical protein
MLVNWLIGGLLAQSTVAAASVLGVRGGVCGLGDSGSVILLTLHGGRGTASVHSNRAVVFRDVIDLSAKVTTSGTTVQVTDVTVGVTKKLTGPGASYQRRAFPSSEDHLALSAAELGHTPLAEPHHCLSVYM